MYVHFTSEEKKFLVKEPFNWHASEDAPDDIKQSIYEKVNAHKTVKEENQRTGIVKHEV